ncbi:hypothetical protein LXL04_007675 [Taraxacum kok-saghyz]
MAVQMRTIIGFENGGTNLATYSILPQINFLLPERCLPPNIYNHMLWIREKEFFGEKLWGFD